MCLHTESVFMVIPRIYWFCVWSVLVTKLLSNVEGRESIYYLLTLFWTFLCLHFCADFPVFIYLCFMSYVLLRIEIVKHCTNYVLVFTFTKT